jgi:hypothetical protein
LQSLLLHQPHLLMARPERGLLLIVVLRAGLWLLLL